MTEIMMRGYFIIYLRIHDFLVAPCTYHSHLGRHRLALSCTPSIKATKCTIARLPSGSSSPHLGDAPHQLESCGSWAVR
jgi:hypothetical protein